MTISRLKEGSYQDEEMTLPHHTYLYVFSVRKFKTFLVLKALEYDNKWELGAGVDESDLLSDDDSYELSMDEDKTTFCLQNDHSGKRMND